MLTRIFRVYQSFFSIKGKSTQEGLCVISPNVFHILSFVVLDVRAPHNSFYCLCDSQGRVSDQHQSQLDNRLQELREKEEETRRARRRLEEQEASMDQERERLQATVSRLETHIKEQNIQLEEVGQALPWWWGRGMNYVWAVISW